MVSTTAISVVAWALLWVTEGFPDSKRLKQFIADNHDAIRNIDKEGNTMLHKAVSKNYTYAVKLLLEANDKVAVDFKNDYGFTPLHKAILQNKQEYVKALLRAGANYEEMIGKKGKKYKGRPLHLAIRKNYPEIITVLMDAGADVNGCDDEGQTAVHYAVMYGDKETVMKLAVRTNVNVNAKDNSEMTPLHLCADLGKESLARILIRLGGDKDAVDAEGQTPLMRAVKREKFQTVKALLTAGANPNIPDFSGATTLYEAVVRNNKEVVEILVDFNADVNKNGEDKIPLLYAVQKIRAHESIIRSLVIDGNADVNVFGMNDHTPLHSAVTSGRFDLVEMFVEVGADVNAKLATNGRTPLMMAIVSLMMDSENEVVKKMIKYLISREDVDLEEKDAFGWNLLHFAYRCGVHDDTVPKYLYDRGYMKRLLYAGDIDGHTPLREFYALPKPKYKNALLIANCVPSMNEHQAEISLQVLNNEVYVRLKTTESVLGYDEYVRGAMQVKAFYHSQRSVKDYPENQFGRYARGYVKQRSAKTFAKMYAKENYHALLVALKGYFPTYAIGRYNRFNLPHIRYLEGSVKRKLHQPKRIYEKPHFLKSMWMQPTFVEIRHYEESVAKDKKSVEKAVYNRVMEGTYFEDFPFALMLDVARDDDAAIDYRVNPLVSAAWAVKELKNEPEIEKVCEAVAKLEERDFRKCLKINV